MKYKELLVAGVLSMGAISAFAAGSFTIKLDSSAAIDINDVKVSNTGTDVSLNGKMLLINNNTMNNEGYFLLTYKKYNQVITLTMANKDDSKLILTPAGQLFGKPLCVSISRCTLSTSSNNGGSGCPTLTLSLPSNNISCP